MTLREAKKKTQDIWWRMFLLKFPNLSLEEFKVLMLMDILTNGTHCVRFPQPLALRAAGVSNAGVQEKVKKELIKKRILLELDETNHNYVLHKICRTCPLFHKDAECRARRPNFFINKNVEDWKTPHMPKINRPLIHQLFEDNGLDGILEDTRTLNKTIEDKINLEKPKPSFHETEVFQEFMEKKVMQLGDF